MSRPDKFRERAFAEVLFGRLKVTPQIWIASERPDSHFFIGEKHVGMEITESTPSEKYWGMAISKNIEKYSESHPIVYSAAHLRNYERQRRKDELFDDMYNNKTYVNLEDVRRFWCEDVRRAWSKKRCKLNETDYKKYEENWLLIWDNDGLSDDHVTFEEIGSEIRRSRFFEDDVGEFDHVFVLSGRYTFDFIPGKFRYWIERDDGTCVWIIRKDEN